MGTIYCEWTHSFLIPPNRQLDKLLLHNRTSPTKKEQLTETRGIWKSKRKIPTGRTGREHTCRISISLHLLLSLPLPQLCSAFPMVSPDIPITLLNVLLTGMSVKTGWTYRKHTSRNPWFGCMYLRSHEWVRQNTHLWLTHAHLGGLLGTKWAFTTTMNFCKNLRQEQKHCTKRSKKGFG